MPADRFTWTHLNRLQLGKYAEYLVKMEFVLLGFDVFTSEVDDRGIDLVVRTPAGNHYDIQAKSYRPGTGNVYLYRIHPVLLLAVVGLVDGVPPSLFLVPSCLPEGANPLFRKCYFNQKREAEWGLSLSKKNLVILANDYKFQDVATRLCG
jgi:hypothetical protein